MNVQLQRHMNCHSDEAKFPCKYCDKRYKSAAAVVKHQDETKGRGCEGLKRLQAMGYSVPERRGYTKPEERLKQSCPSGTS